MTRRSHRPRQDAVPTESIKPTEKISWSAPLRGLLALTVFVAVLIIFSAPAHAGTYSVYSCKGPANEPLGSAGWVAGSLGAPTTDFDYVNDCPGAGLSVSTKASAAYANTNSGFFRFTPPTDTELSGFQIKRQLQTLFMDVGYGTYTSVVRERRGASVVSAGCVARTTNCTFGVPVADTVEENLSPADSVSIEVVCNAAPCPVSNGNVDVKATLVGSRIDLLDDYEPQVLNATGSLISGPAIPGSRSVVIATSDRGSGIRRVSLSVDGGAAQIDEPGGNCVEPFSTPVPCPLTHTSSFSVDTSGLAVGAHNLSVLVEDAAGGTVNYGPIPFTVLAPTIDPVDPGPPVGSDGQPLTNGVPAVERPQLSLGQSRIESKSAGMTSIVGTLRAPDGTPIVGATVLPLSIDLGSAEEPAVSLPGVTTGADGSFSVAVEVKGAKRIRIAFRPNLVSAETAIASVVVRQALKLSVKRSKARVKRRGRIVLSGVLTGAGSATNDAPVEINALVKGKWRAVGVVETNSKGKYSWKYRFVSVRRTTKFKFRALVRRSAAWPWPTKVGRTVSVRVSP